MVKIYEVVWLHVFPAGYRLDIVHCTGLTGLTVNCECVVLVTVQGPGLGGGWRDITRYSHAAACDTDSSGQQLYGLQRPGAAPGRETATAELFISLP